MKIVISPAKSLNYHTEVPTSKFTQPVFLKEAERINKVLAGKKPKALSKLMDISAELADLNWKRNQEFTQPFNLENARQAIFAFDGDVYQGLRAYEFSEAQLDQLQDSLRILSGQYGILKPLDLMQAYRLEMGTSLRIGGKKNLYDFWKKRLTDSMNSELEAGELFINLASNEYFKALDAKKLKVPVITPIFKDWKGEKLMTISFFAKKARGAMVRYIIENSVTSLEALKGFDWEDYCFSKEHTLAENQPVFVR